MSAQDPVVGTPDGAWSSSTTAQAAEPEHKGEDCETIDKVCLVRPVGGRVLGPQDADALRVPVAVLAADIKAVAEHPDTIALRECRRSREEYATALGATETALRECRAELEQAVKRSQHNHDCSMRDSKRAWDAEQSLESARAERDTALARIAELETECEGHIEAYLGLNEGLRAYEQSIARAVAELKQMPEGHYLHVVRALEALR